MFTFYSFYFFFSMESKKEETKTTWNITSTFEMPKRVRDRVGFHTTKKNIVVGFGCYSKTHGVAHSIQKEIERFTQGAIDVWKPGSTIYIYNASDIAKN